MSIFCKTVSELWETIKHESMQSIALKCLLHILVTDHKMFIGLIKLVKYYMWHHF